MSALTINGVDLPVAIDSLTAGFEPVGTTGRNTRGHHLKERRRDKWVFEFDLSPAPLEEVLLYRSLILGDGEFWSTETNQWGAKGLGLTGTGAWIGSGGGNPLTGSGNGVFRLTTGQTMVVPGKLYDQSAVTAAAAGLSGATLAAWRYDDTLAAYRIFAWSWRALDSVVTHKREKLGAIGASGAVQNFTGTETLAVSGGNLTVTAPGSGGPWRYSNLLLIPWFLPLAQVDQLLEGLALVRYQLPKLPRVYVQTDLLPVDQLKTAPVGSVQSSIICHGEVESLRVTPLMRNGAFSTTECVLSGSLIEV
jgi:hypothetical protein